MALGFAVVLAVFLLETVVAHQRLPSPASPYVWGLLGSGSLVCLALAGWFHRKTGCCSRPASRQVGPVHLA